MHILVLLNSDIRQEQRVNKEMATLRQAGHTVTLVYLPVAFESPDPTSPLRPVRLWTRRLPRNLLFWPLKYIECALRFARAGLRLRPHAVHCVDRLTLLPGLLVSRFLGIPLVYDTQEVWAEVHSALNRPRWLWLAFERHVAGYAFRILVTDHFRLTLTAEILKRPLGQLAVLMNLPNRNTPDTDGRPHIRTDSGFSNQRLLVYAGAISPGRHLEECIGALEHLAPDCALALVGFGDAAYKSRLLELARTLGVTARVAMLPAVPWSAISSYIRPADCAFAFYEKSSINNLYCSPSKLFDALLAGVPVVGTDNPLIVEVLAALDAGQTVAQVTSMSIALAVEAVLSRADAPTRGARIAAMARETYTWEHQEQVLRGIYEELERSR